MVHAAAALMLLFCSVSVCAAQVHPQRVRATESAMRARLIHKVDPTPPGDAAHIEGAVAFKALIGKAGNVQKLELISGHPMLVPAAIEAVKQWKYRPFLLNGWPLEVETTITVEFPTKDKASADKIRKYNSREDSGSKPLSFEPGTPLIPIPMHVRVSSGVEERLSVKKVPPEYPAKARERYVEGTVSLKVQISKQGAVENVELISGHPLLAPAAIDAVKKWKYRPYLLNGEPVEVETQVQVNFTLQD